MPARPPSRPPGLPLRPPDGDGIARGVFTADMDRRRRAELRDRLEERIGRVAAARREDPYDLLADAIRRLLRG